MNLHVPAPLAPHAPPHVLLVEDDLDQALLLRRWLETERMSVTHAGSSREGRALAARRGIDLVLTDLCLGDASGLDVVRASKEHAPGRPALVMTAHGDVQAAVGALRERADDFLGKPLVRAQVVARVRELVDAARATQRKVVVAIGAHPDDVEIGVGGTLAWHRAQGHLVVVVTCTRGAHGGKAGARGAESEAAARLLEAGLVLGDLADTQVTDGLETIALLEAPIKTFGADIVYTHSVHDVHQDHRAVHRATLVAARGVPEVYCYQSPSTTPEFVPSRFVDIEDHLGAKQALIACYGSQTAIRPYLAPSLIEATARYWGRFAGYRAVEPLEVVRTK